MKHDPFIGKEIEPERVFVHCGNDRWRRAKRLTEPSEGLQMLGNPPWKVGNEMVVIDEEQPSGKIARMLVHISQLRKP